MIFSETRKVAVAVPTNKLSAQAADNRTATIWYQGEPEHQNVQKACALLQPLLMSPAHSPLVFCLILKFILKAGFLS